MVQLHKKRLVFFDTDSNPFGAIFAKETWYRALLFGPNSKLPLSLLGNEKTGRAILQQSCGADSNLLSSFC